MPSQYVLAGAVHEFGLGSRFGELFDEVHRSNMSKASSSRAVAEQTVSHYQAYKGEQGQIEEVNGAFVVYRAKDRKILKSVEYSPASLATTLNSKPPQDDAPTGDAPPARRQSKGWSEGWAMEAARACHGLVSRRSQRSCGDKPRQFSFRKPWSSMRPSSASDNPAQASETP